MKKLLSIFAILCFLAAVTASLSQCKKPEVPGSIYGVITDKATGEPIRSAGVQLNNGTKTITGTEGQYEFTELKAGEYTLTVTKTGYTDLVGYKITVTAGQTTQGDVQIEKLPPALRIVNDKGQDIDSLDFGSSKDVVTRSFGIFNDSPDELTWEITKTSNWITVFNKTSGSIKANDMQPVVITINRDSLSNGKNTTYIHIIFNNGSKDLKVTAIGEERNLPTLNTLDVSNVTTSKATLNGTILNAGKPAYTERGFVYSTSSNPTLETTLKVLTVDVGSNKTYLYNVSGLELGKTYYVRAYAKNSVGTAYSSNEKSFTTEMVLPNLTTDNVSHINRALGTVTFNGMILTVGDPNYTERGFVYGERRNPTIEDDNRKPVIGNGTGAFSSNIDGLVLGKIYYVRAYATNSRGTAYGIEKTLDFNAIMPVVTTQTVTEINENAVTLNGTIVSVGEPEFIEKGFIYGIEHISSIDDGTKKIVSGNETGKFQASLTGLITNKIYYARAYATNSVGTVYGSEISFTPSHPEYMILQSMGIMVQKQDVVRGIWSVVNEACETSQIGGFNDWELPTIGQLTSLYNERNTIGGFNQSISSGWYWSSTSSSNGHWSESFSNGTTSDDNDNGYSQRGRCVRAITP